MSRIFSPGKLMLTSEYVAVDGALVLAIPTKLGHELFYTENENQKSLIFWEAYHQNQLWLKATIDYNNGKIIETNDFKASEFARPHRARAPPHHAHGRSSTPSARSPRTRPGPRPLRALGRSGGEAQVPTPAGRSGGRARRRPTGLRNRPARSTRRR